MTHQPNGGNATGFTVLIPARLASSRLPDKPLADIVGLPMVVRVAQAAAASSATRVVVAADSARIVSACQSHGIAALLTRSDHPSGSDRLAEACVQLGLDGDDLVVNVQGDEPLIAPAMIDACAALLRERPDCVMATVAHAIEDVTEFTAPIAWWRDGFAQGIHQLPASPAALRHVGLYAYRAGFLRRFPALPVAPLETLESLEQLRVLWHGERIAVHVSAERPGPGVDTPEDLARVRALFEAI